MKLDVVFDYPTSGAIISDSNITRNKKKDSRKNDARPFQFFPKNIDDSIIHWDGRSEDGELLVQWNSLSKSEIFDATVELYADCVDSEIDTSKSVADNIVRINNVSSLSISRDAGFGAFSTVNQEKLSGHVATDFGSPSFFWLDRETNIKKIKITQSVEKPAALTIWNDARNLGFFVNTILAASTEQGIATSARTLRFKINGKNYSVASEKPKKEADETLLVCKTLQPGGAVDKEQVTISGANGYFGALVHISKRILPASVFGIEDNELKVTGGNGWASLTRTNEKMTNQHESSTANLLSFKGNIASLDIDRSSVATRAIDEYHAFGEFVGGFEDSAKVRFSGEAKALWKNSARVNPTKWERLGWEQRVYLLTIMVSIFGTIAGYVLIQIKYDANIAWLRSLSGGLAKRNRHPVSTDG